MTMQTTLETAKPASRAGRYLAFTLAGEEYGVEILKVREITRLTDVTPVPCTPWFIRGVMNLRGKVIPVADLRLRLGMPETQPTAHTCTIVIQSGAGEMGIVVDGVLEVVGLSAGDIEATPSFGASVDVSFIAGIASAGARTIILLDIDSLFAGDDFVSTLTAQSENPQ
jgi:purine-binding chemotaxis protein CheW